jgi:predicted protein tyrosine phosphatase
LASSGLFTHEQRIGVNHSVVWHGRPFYWRETIKTATKLFIALAVFGFTTGSIGLATARDDQSYQSDDLNWSELIASMDKMHMAMGAVARSGNGDVDFVRLMVPHHQAAIDMAKTQLLYGKDPQMRRLAQEIITDQQLEIELMQRWLKQRESTQPKENQR